jgi:hypothetical protein
LEPEKGRSRREKKNTCIHTHTHTHTKCSFFSSLFQIVLIMAEAKNTKLSDMILNVEEIIKTIMS